MLLLLQADWILLQAGWPQVRRRHQPWWTFPPQVVLHSLSWRKASGGMVSRVLMCPHIVLPALVGCTLDGRHSILDKGFQLLGIFLYPGQHNLGVNPVIGRCWLLPPGEWRQSWAAAWTTSDSPGAPVWAW